MKSLTILSLIAVGALVALPASARLAANKLAANGVAVQGYDSSILSVQAVILADGTKVALH